MKQFWNGVGDADGHVYFTLNNGQVVRRPYLRRRVVATINYRCGHLSEGERARQIAATVDDDEWLRYRASNTVSSICRAASIHAI